jgi:hypothetical protein
MALNTNYAPLHTQYIWNTGITKPCAKHIKLYWVHPAKDDNQIEKE